MFSRISRLVAQRYLWTAGGAILLAGCVQPRPGSPALEEKYTRWTRYEAEPGASHFSALDQINRSNVGQLQVAWQYETGGPAPAGHNPIVIDTIMYVLGKENSVVALNAATGRELWTSKSAVPGTISQRGIMYWESADRSDRRLLFTKGNYDLVALDALTGQPVASFGNNGRVDMRQGLDRDPGAIPRATSGSPGVVFGDIVILGSAPGEGYVAGPGHIRGFDVRTGRQLWIFHTLPKPGEFGYESWPAGRSDNAGGANAWGGLSLDEKRGIVYAPLGSANYDFYGVDRPGNNLFANSVIALDARTGKRLWHFQTVHHDLWDYDLTATPTLLTIRHDGKMVDVVAQAGKTGWVYVLDRVTGQPIWPIEERPVPASDMPGEQASPTQPIPTKPAPFAKIGFNEGDLNPYIDAADRDSIARYVSGMLNKGMFTPPSTRPTMQMPGNRGGANWGTTAADPRDGTFYVLSHNVPYELKLELITPGAFGTGGSPIDRGQATFRANCQACHLANRQGQPAAGIPSLVGVTDRISHADFPDIVHFGRGQMPAFPQMTDQEIDALMAYLASPQLALSSDVPVTGPAPGGAAAGSATPSEGGEPIRYQSGWNSIRDKNGMPIVKPPWFVLTAYDMNQGTIKWQVPMGDHPYLLDKGITAATGSGANLNGGPAVTAGNLLFQVTRDKLRAVDKDTGKELWAGQLPANASGTPAVYQVGGREYIVVAATMATPGGQGTQPRPRYIAFALPRTGR
jgi:quinoprotein glucose dehydrogenase